jgi:hypothetical protein
MHGRNDNCKPDRSPKRYFRLCNIGQFLTFLDKLTRMCCGLPSHLSFRGLWIGAGFNWKGVKRLLCDYRDGAWLDCLQGRSWRGQLLTVCLVEYVLLHASFTVYFRFTVRHFELSYRRPTLGNVRTQKCHHWLEHGRKCGVAVGISVMCHFIPDIQCTYCLQTTILNSGSRTTSCSVKQWYYIRSWQNLSSIYMNSWNSHVISLSEIV